MGEAETAGATAPPIPLPPLLTLPGAIPLVARHDAWRVLDDNWAAAAGAARRVILLPGEPGAGKTRLATEFARTVHRQGAAVLYGTCSEEQTVPYQPFAEALDHLLGTVPPAMLATGFGAAASELARLVPRRAAELGLPEPAGRGDPDAERARLFGAVIDVVARLARDQPLLVLLDDLHWARPPTVDLLMQLVHDQTLTNVVILCAYRSAPVDIGDALRATLPELRRLPGVARLPVTGLDAAGIEAFLAAAAGHAVGTDLRGAVDVLARQTDGNVFLLVELWLHLIESGHLQRRGDRWVVAGALTDIISPEGVREVVGARLARLDPSARELLGTAAVIGPTFDPAILAAAAATPPVDVLSTLDVAVQSQIVGEDGSGTFRFAHELIRRSIYDALGSGERRRHHLEIARALERDGSAIAELARHLTAAVPLVDAREAVDAATRAADAATAAVAYHDAARFLEAALDAAIDRRTQLMLRFADATMRAGDVAAAKARCVEAHDLARRTGDASGRIAAALAYGEAAWRDARDGETAVQLLRGVLPLASDEITSVRLQASLTRALALTGTGETARMLGEDALASARRLGDPEALHLAFDALTFVPWTPSTARRQLEVTRESADTAQRLGDPQWEASATSKVLYGEISTGELDAARTTAARHHELASRVGQPLFGVLDRQARALLAVGEGRFGDAEVLAAEADELTSALSNAPSGAYGVQLFSIRREQGRLDEARPIVEAVARLGRSGATWRPALAVMYAELGLLVEAAAELAVLTADRLAAVPRDALWLGSLSYLADTCCAVGDDAAAATVYAELVEWRGLVVQVGQFLAAHGAVDRYLGALAALLGREREAQIHFEAALALDQRAGMPVWLAHSELAYGRPLLGSDRAAGKERGRQLVASALATAERLGMAGMAAAARTTLGLEAVGPARTGGGAAGLTEREVAVLRLVAVGRSNRDIGSTLHISQHTAANHVRSILMKTACANRTEAAAWALRRGLLDGQ